MPQNQEKNHRKEYKGPIMQMHTIYVVTLLDDFEAYVHVPRKVTWGFNFANGFCHSECQRLKLPKEEGLTLVLCRMAPSVMLHEGCIIFSLLILGEGSKQAWLPFEVQWGKFEMGRLNISCSKWMNIIPLGVSSRGGTSIPGHSDGFGLGGGKIFASHGGMTGGVDRFVIWRYWTIEIAFGLEEGWAIRHWITHSPCRCIMFNLSLCQKERSQSEATLPTWDKASIVNPSSEVSFGLSSITEENTIDAGDGRVGDDGTLTAGLSIEVDYVIVDKDGDEEFR
ncbi:hypothetical protein EDC04DRAFT_2614210 [Pisolithus marmoratus]|nr:hypothetical protein EDC04DRAFT_2614210 [Pisolithus marmoratus]